MAIGALLGGLGGYIASPAGQAMAGGLTRGGLGLLGRYLASRRPPGPEQLAQQQMLQQMQQQQPFQEVSFDPIRQEELRRFKEETIPGIAHRFTGMGGQRSSAFRHSLSGAGEDLAKRLQALQTQHETGQQQARMQAGGMEQQRLSNLAAYLGGQQQLGLGSQQLAQRRREASMVGLGGLGQHARGAGLLGIQRGLAPIAGGMQAAGYGLGQMSQQQYQPGTQGWVPGMAGGLLDAFKEIASAYAGRR